MRTKVLLFAFLCGVLVTVTAQEYQPQIGYSIENGSKTNFKKNGAGDNWVISLGGAATMYMGDYNGDANLGDRLSWMASLSFAKWANPYLGFRLKLDGGPFKDFAYARGPGGVGELTQRDFIFGNAHLDLLWDITNFWAPYNEKKVVRLIPFAGAGYAYRPSKEAGGFPNKKSESPTLNLGVQMPFRLSNRVDLFLEYQYTMLNEEFNRVNIGHEEDRLISAMLGFNFKLGRTNWEVIETMDYDLLNDLNNQINALRAQNDELSKRPKSCPECPQIQPVVQSIEHMKNAVFFRLNSSVIDKNQEGNIFNTAEYAKKHNLPIKLIGYADKDTGTADYNYGLSERRARAVAKMLTEKHGIATEKLSIEWQGDRVQPYQINNWNRLVIMDTNK